MHMNRAAIAFLCALIWLYPRGAAAADAANCSLKLVNTVPLKLAYEGRRAVVPVTSREPVEPAPQARVAATAPSTIRGSVERPR